MCLGVPGRILSWADDDRMLARVDLDGVPRDVNMVLVGEDGPAVGDWVLVHVGFATTVMAEEEARDLLATLREVDARRRAEVAEFTNRRAAQGEVTVPGDPGS